MAAVSGSQVTVVRECAKWREAFDKQFKLNQLKQISARKFEEFLQSVGKEERALNVRGNASTQEFHLNQPLFYEFNCYVLRQLQGNESLQDVFLRSLGLREIPQTPPTFPPCLTAPVATMRVVNEFLTTRDHLKLRETCHWTHTTLAPNGYKIMDQYLHPSPGLLQQGKQWLQKRLRNSSTSLKALNSTPASSPHKPTVKNFAGGIINDFLHNKTIYYGSYVNLQMMISRKQFLPIISTCQIFILSHSERDNLMQMPMLYELRTPVFPHLVEVMELRRATINSLRRRRDGHLADLPIPAFADVKKNIIQNNPQATIFIKSPCTEEELIRNLSLISDNFSENIIVPEIELSEQDRKKSDAFIILKTWLEDDSSNNQFTMQLPLYDLLQKLALNLDIKVEILVSDIYLFTAQSEFVRQFELQAGDPEILQQVSPETLGKVMFYIANDEEVNTQHYRSTTVTRPPNLLTLDQQILLIQFYLLQYFTQKPEKPLEGDEGKN